MTADMLRMMAGLGRTAQTGSAARKDQAADIAGCSAFDAVMGRLHGAAQPPDETPGPVQAATGGIRRADYTSDYSWEPLTLEGVGALGESGSVQSVSLEDLLKQRHGSQLVYHVFDASGSKWQRNDYPHYKLYQKNLNTYEMEHWQASGPEPEYQQSQAIRALSQVPAGMTAVVIHPAVQARMEDDPQYAIEIYNRIEAWFTFDACRNEAMMPGINARSSRCVAIGEDGSICNAQSFSHGELTYSGDPDGKTVDAWDERMRRHEAYMRRRVAYQIEHKLMLSEQLNEMAAQSAAKRQLQSLMSDPALRTALGEKIGSAATDAVFSITAQKVFQANSPAVLP